MERLIITTEASGKFAARLESTGELVVAGTRQPLVDGARVLLARGFDPSTELTMRHTGKGFDSFLPLAIGKWAKVAYGEKDGRGLVQRPWIPFPGTRVGQKEGSEAEKVAGAILPTPEPHRVPNQEADDD